MDHIRAGAEAKSRPARPRVSRRGTGVRCLFADRRRTGIAAALRACIDLEETALMPSALPGHSTFQGNCVRSRRVPCGGSAFVLRPALDMPYVRISKLPAVPELRPRKRMHWRGAGDLRGTPHWPTGENTSAGGEASLPRSRGRPKADAKREVVSTSGERAGTRTQDHLIKSQVLYQLSYALPAADLRAGPDRVNRRPAGRRGLHGTSITDTGPA